MGQPTELFQLIYGFVMGLILGPLAGNIVFVLLTVVIIEVYTFWSTATLPQPWRFEARVAINLFALIGWVLGRWLILGETGLENLSDLPYRVFRD